uniref:Uncharacterized protein n=1 Tax=mine drainage metagenome TaxID=410659 RepID=E6QC70_9ZZZZ
MRKLTISRRKVDQLTSNANALHRQILQRLLSSLPLVSGSFYQVGEQRIAEHHDEYDNQDVDRQGLYHGQSDEQRAHNGRLRFRLPGQGIQGSGDGPAHGERGPQYADGHHQQAGYGGR